jgi:DNA-binding FadR family transcriptional regulator
MPQTQLSSTFLQYLARYTPASEATNGGIPNTAAPSGAAASGAAASGAAADGVTGPAQLPSLNEVSKELGVSVALLREQLEVARAIGLVEVRPRTGIRRLPYAFLPAVRQSLSYALAVDPGYFMAYSDLRIHLEATYWQEAAGRLTQEDQQELISLVRRARDKLNGHPIEIPHPEHRQFHLGIYRRLENPFVLGLLEAYWEAYEAVGLNLYTDIDYLHEVWQYHEQMAQAIRDGDLARGYAALLQHKDLLFHRPDTPR